MKISIGIPVYGVEDYIERCCTSIFNQTYQNLEIVFVNDVTPDNSIEIINKTLIKYPSRISQTKIINHERNKGLAETRNTIINNITGEYIVWVDSDDYIENNTIEILVNELKNDNYDIISFGSITHHKNHNIVNHVPKFYTPKDFTLALIAKTIPVSIWGRMIKVSIYKMNQIKTIEGNNMGEDYQVTPKLSYYAKKVHFIDLPLYHYNFTNNNSYCNSFSPSKMLQLWNSYLNIEIFFHQKGKEYCKSLELGKVKTLIILFKDCLKQGFNNEHFIQLHQIAKSIKRPIKGISLYDKIILNIPNITLLKLYIFTARTIKNLIKKI